MPRQLHLQVEKIIDFVFVIQETDVRPAYGHKQQHQKLALKNGHKWVIRGRYESRWKKTHELFSWKEGHPNTDENQKTGLLEDMVNR
jgi:hypothetical protein